jgi:hypothetical protein
MKLKNFIEQKEQLTEDITDLLNVLIFLDDSLEESISSKIEDFLSSIGFRLKKNTGLIQMLYKAGKDIYNIVVTAIKAVNGGEREKTLLKITIKKSKISKEQFVDFVLKLDDVTLGILRQPLVMIEALTGWQITPNIENLKKVKERILNAVVEVELLLTKLSTKVSNKTKIYLDKIKNLVMADNA